MSTEAMALPFDAWSWAHEPVATPLDSGLINATWRLDVDGEPVAAMQRLNTDIFSVDVHHDIEAITARLEQRGMLTPRLMPTRAEGLWHTDGDGGVWRCLSWVGDRTVAKLDDPADAESGGLLVARFHGAVTGLHHSFRSVRPGTHDTPKHMARLQQALGVHALHRLHSHVRPLAAEVFDFWDHWEGPGRLPERIIHGDLKISNLRFEGSRAAALIDFDTLQLGTLDAELGDAMRSWCNRATEDEPAQLDLDLFEAAMRGYARGMSRGPHLLEREWQSIVPGWLRITVELSARFLTDALEERYFGFNARYGSRGEHNLLRARGQLSLARSLIEQHEQAEAALSRARESAKD